MHVRAVFLVSAPRIAAVPTLRLASKKPVVRSTVPFAEESLSAGRDLDMARKAMLTCRHRAFTFDVLLLLRPSRFSEEVRLNTFSCNAKRPSADAGGRFLLRTFANPDPQSASPQA
jgi:hypothetical protein